MKGTFGCPGNDGFYLSLGDVLGPSRRVGKGLDTERVDAAGWGGGWASSVYVGGIPVCVETGKPWI